MRATWRLIKLFQNISHDEIFRLIGLVWTTIVVRQNDPSACYGFGFGYQEPLRFHNMVHIYFVITRQIIQNMLPILKHSAHDFTFLGDIYSMDG